MIADLAYAQLRRYTEYNHYSNPSGAEISSFQIGDIFIDPARRKVEVRGQPVNLRPREFSLLLYFMRNPKIVLLYLHGKVDNFHDIDIMVKECDTDKTESILSSLGRPQPPNPAVQYKTKRFLEYVIDGVDVDVMSGFVVINDGVEYDCSLRDEQVVGTVIVESQTIPLHSIGLWKRYYRLMGRASKVAILEDIDEE